MDIVYLGHASFKIRGKEGVVVTDPFDPQKIGLSWNKVKADLVTISHNHGDHNYSKGVEPSSAREGKDLIIIDGPGEYEAGGMMVQGWETFHDDKSGEERGKNTIYLIEVEKVRVLHLGDLGHELKESLIEEFGQVDVLMIPVGGYYTVNAKVAAKIVKSIGPSYVIPMHYQVEGLSLSNKLDGVEMFLKEMDVNGVEARDKLTVTESALIEGTQVVLMNK